jgi:hypothetical protein
MELENRGKVVMHTETYFELGLNPSRIVVVEWYNPEGTVKEHSCHMQCLLGGKKTEAHPDGEPYLYGGIYCFGATSKEQAKQALIERKQKYPEFKHSKITEVA